jgi:hypothetical protein
MRTVYTLTVKGDVVFSTSSKRAAFRAAHALRRHLPREAVDVQYSHREVRHRCARHELFDCTACG